MEPFGTQWQSLINSRVQCPKCFVKLKNRNLIKHLRKHGDGVESKSNATKASVHEKPDVTKSRADAKIQFYSDQGVNLFKRPKEWSPCPICLVSTRNNKLSKHLSEQHGYKTRNERNQENLEKLEREKLEREKLEAVKARAEKAAARARQNVSQANPGFETDSLDEDLAGDMFSWSPPPSP